MTEEQKDILISRMLECRAELSDAEITQILADEELRDIYSISVDIKAAKENQIEIDASAEWNRFRLNLVKPRRWNIGLLTRVAAILAGILLLSAAIFFMTTKETSNQELMFAHNDKHAIEDTNTTEPLTANTIAVNGNNNNLQVSSQRPRYVRKPMLARTSMVKNANNPQTLDVEEYMRIELARMDNDLAMQRAEAVADRYYAMANINEAMQSDLGDGYSMEDEIVTLIIP